MGYVEAQGGEAIRIHPNAAAEDPAPYLHRIGSLANSVEESAALVSEFIARCRGGGNGKVGSTDRPVSSGYIGQLDRLHEAAAELNKLAHELSAIG